MNLLCNVLASKMDRSAASLTTCISFNAVLGKCRNVHLTNSQLASVQNPSLPLTLWGLTKNLNQTVGTALYFLKYWKELILFPSFA